ncbi:hypothetical protein GC096_30415 [Paenibacillus sp. LMG 31461]|uniref:Helicase n=1 Tax=Paenibacillus plantarum TaxID=2654975 RepID=A0ABX1XKG5_9BACL|nr:helicase-related protein [Paenibacillus plantarum]NOU68344.1 hypothetical protein [Paenibacillus plantarum]
MSINSNYNWKEERVIDNQLVTMQEALSYYLGKSICLDIAVGYFFISGFKLLQPALMKMMEHPDSKIRLLMGTKTDFRTADVLDEGYSVNLTPQEALMAEIASGQADDNSLHCLVEWIKSGRVDVKVYKGEGNYFHSKLYLLHREPLEDREGYAIIGSSNFTKSGLTINLELNAVTMDAFMSLSRWFDVIWISEEAKAYSRDLIEIIEREISKSAHYLTGQATYVEFAKSFAKPLLDSYIKKDFTETLYEHQKIGIGELVARITQFGCAVLSDGVGLGKTRTAVSIIRALGDVKTIIIVPKKLQNQWVDEINIVNVPLEAIAFYSKEQISRMSLKELRETFSDISFVIIDEAHQGLRHSTTKLYRNIHQLTKEFHDIQGLLLTATPYNNSRRDIYHLGRLFLRPIKVTKNSSYKEYLGFANRKAAKGFELDDAAFKEFWRDLFLQRTRRTYGGKDVSFAKREFPVIEIRYEPAKQTVFELNYERIGNLHLPYMNTFRYYESPEWEELSSEQLKLMLLKRADSSWYAFLSSIIKVKSKLNALMIDIERIESAPNLLKEFKRWLSVNYGIDENFSDFEEWFIEDHELTDFELRSRQRRAQYVRRMLEKIDAVKKKDATQMLKRMRQDSQTDLNQLKQIEDSLKEGFQRYDEKYEKVKKEILLYISQGEKVLIISQFRDTVLHYFERLEKEIHNLKIGLVTGQAADARVTGEQGLQTKENILNRFSPVSKGHPEYIGTIEEIQVVIGTETLSVGQNLQDCRVLFNLDLPFNPMNVEQRIGRIDRPRNDGQVGEVLILTFPSMSAIEAELKMVERLGKKLIGVYQDTAFDELVMPEYRKYLEESVKNKQVTGSMISRMIDNVVDRSHVIVDEEMHSQAYHTSQQRMWESIRLSPPLIIKPVFPDISYGSQDYFVCIVRIIYRDTNGTLLREETIPAARLSEQWIYSLSEVETLWYQGSLEDIKSTKGLSVETAEKLRKAAIMLLDELKQTRISHYNEAIVPKRKRDELIDARVKQVKKAIIEDINGQNRRYILDKLNSKSIEPRAVKEFIDALDTIDIQDHEYELIIDLYQNVSTLWERFEEFYFTILGSREEHGTSQTQSDLRLADNSQSDISWIIGHFGIKQEEFIK